MTAIALPNRTEFPIRTALSDLISRVFSPPFGKVFRPVFDPGAAVAAVGPYLLDNFTDADDTAIAAHTIAPNNTPVASWSTLGGVWKITSNQAVTSSADGVNFAVLESLVADCVISAEVHLHVAAGFIFRCTDATHGWILQIGGNAIRVFLNTGAGWAERASAACTLVDDSTYTLTLTLLADTLSAVCNGVTLDYAAAYTYATNTKHGMYIYNNASSIDNFQITI